VYNKGAEVVRMIHSLLGADGFRKGMDLYFERHDGQAVTTDDFRLAMQDANQFDLSQFQRWYDQSSTPKVFLRRDYNPETGTLRLHVRQEPGKTHDEPNLPFMIPMRLALFDTRGNPLPVNDKGDLEQVVQITELEQYYDFGNLPQKPVISAFRGFTAPVLIETACAQKRCPS